MRISDRSSDVCSSDLATCPGSTEGRTGQREPFPRCCIRSVTQELSMPDRATTETVAWSTLPDAELVALARRGQRGAFRELMRRCNQRLFRVARAVVRDDAEAEDVVQEAYTHAFAGLSTFRGESSLSTWLTRIVLNEANGRLRKRRPSVDIATFEATPQADSRVLSFPNRFGREDPAAAAAPDQLRGLLEPAIDAIRAIGLASCMERVGTYV